MTDPNHVPPSESNSTPSVSTISQSPAVAIAAVTFLAGLGAAGAAFGLSDLAGLGVGVLIAAAGAGVAAMAASKVVRPSDVKAAALLKTAMADDAPAQPPARFRGEPWFSIYARVAGYAEAQRAATLAVQEADKLREELARLTGKPVPTSDAADRVEPFDTTADAEVSAPSPARFVAPPVHTEEDVVGSAPVTAPVAPGFSEAEVAARVREALSAAIHPIRQDLGAIEAEMEPLLRALRAAGAKGASAPNTHPAQMVDALVRTAADGIEDLAAGLMRANELATVAERVTNRATLLALNAALEATRSGSEAFASIAEETRRLAEYAREATDTISRLSSEIEVKVGETIASIQSSSEDAKAAVDQLRTGGVSAGRGVDAETLNAFDTVLERVRALRSRALDVPVPAVAPAELAVSDETSEPSAGPTAPYVPPYARPAASAAPAAPDEPAPSYVTLDASEGDASGASETSTSAAPDASTGGADENDAPASPGLPPVVPRVVEKIPDWMEGLEPRDRH